MNGTLRLSALSPSPARRSVTPSWYRSYYRSYSPIRPSCRPSSNTIQRARQGATMRIPSIGLLVAIVCLTGCAHPMTVRPDIDRLPVVSEGSRVPKTVGLYISPEKLNKEVTTSGGGGDKVSYRPYADTETGLYRVLGSAFQDVQVLKSMSDVDTIAKHSVVY